MTTGALLTSGDELRERIKKGSPSIPQFFHLRAQLPSEGKTDIPLSFTDRMWVVLKTYASGGENELHAHPNEDHLFVVLQGRAEFYGPKEEIQRIGKYDCVMLPRGTYYYFKSIDTEPLVMLRVGAVVDPKEDPVYRVDDKGQKMNGFSKENKHVDPVLTDKFFE